MPQLNSRGDVLMGIGSGTVSINGTAIAPGAGIGGWFEDDVALYQQGPPYHLEAYDVATHTKHQVDPNGANVLLARNGRWAAQLGTTIRTSWGKTFQNMGLFALGEDGSLVVTAVHSAGKPIHVIPLSGAPVVLSTGSCLEIAHEWLGRTVWMDYGGKVFAVGVAVPAITGRPKQLLLINGEDWLLQVYQDSKLILHPIADTRGYLVNTGNAFTPAARLLNGVTVAWSIGQGERPSDLRTAMIDTSAPRVDLIAAPPPPPPPPPPPQPVPVISLPRPPALPDRQLFMVGVCWPFNPGAIDPFLPGEAFTAFRSVGLQSIRIDAQESVLLTVAHHGFVPFPVVSVWELRTPKPANLSAVIDKKAAEMEILAARCPWVLEWEIENEPRDRTPPMTPAEGAQIVSVIGRAIKRGNPAAKVYGPGTFGEMLNPIDGTLDKWPRAAIITGTPWYVQFRKELAKTGFALDGQCIHPYRNPNPPEQSGFGSRQAEHAEVLKQTGPMPILCTEVGWDVADRAQAGAYVVRELMIQRNIGLTACFLYAHHGPFGLFDDDWTPRPAALAVQAFVSHPQPPPEPDPEPEPEPVPDPDQTGRLVSFVTSWGHPVFAEKGGGGPLSTGSVSFTAVPLGDGQFAFRAENGQYLCAEDDGGSDLVADRLTIGPWETFTVEPHGDLVALRCHDGVHYVSADLDRGGWLFADRHEVGEWELFTTSVDLLAKPPPVITPPPVPPTLPIVTRLRVAGLQRFNAAGVHRALYVSGFTLPSDIVQQRDKALRFLDWAATLFNGVRVFGAELPWAGQRNADVLVGLPTLLAEARDRNLYVELSAITESGLGYDVEAHYAAVQAIARGFENVDDECANEPYHGTQTGQVHDLNYLAGLGKKYAASPYAVGAVDFDEAEPDGSLPHPVPGDWVSIHLDRSRDEWNMVRRVRELETIQHATRRFVMNNESIGWDEVTEIGRRNANPKVAFAMGLLSRCFDVGVVSHSQDGLRADLPRPVQAECHRMLVRGFRSVPFPEMLTYKNAGWSETSAPIKSFDTSKAVRCYSFVWGTRGVTAIIGKTGDPAIQWQHGWRPIATIDDVGEVVVLEIRQG